MLMKKGGPRPPMITATTGWRFTVVTAAVGVFAALTGNSALALEYEDKERRDA
jgi:hypothetical protein